MHGLAEVHHGIDDDWVIGQLNLVAAWEGEIPIIMPGARNVIMVLTQ